MTGLPETGAVPTFQTASAGANTDVVITLAAAIGVTHVLDWVHFSYDEDASTGVLAITIGGTDEYIIQTSAVAATTQMAFIQFPGGFYGGVNEAMVITLDGGGGTAKGRVNIRYH